MKALLALCIIVFAQTATAQSSPPIESATIDRRAIADVRAALSSPILYSLLDAQNADNAALTPAEIDALDQRWRAEREQDDQPLIGRILGNPLSAYLTQLQAASLGLYTEIFVMDEKGLNVGQSAITSDFWQGDEAKFQRTYLVSPDAVFIDDAEFHEGSATWRAQLNFSVADDAGAAVGAVTVEFNLTELQRRRAAGL